MSECSEEIMSELDPEKSRVLWSRFRSRSNHSTQPSAGNRVIHTDSVFIGESQLGSSSLLMSCWPALS